MGLEMYDMYPPLKCQKYSFALARWLSWLEHLPIHQKVAGSIPPQPGCIQEATDRCILLLSLSLPLSFSFTLSKINKNISLSEDKEKIVSLL